MPRKKTHEEFVNEIEMKWPGKYEVLGEYCGNKTKILIKHKECGTEFKVNPNYFTMVENWEPCPECNKKKKNKIYALPIEDVKSKIYSVWKDEVELIGGYTCATEKMQIKFNSCGHIHNMNLYGVLKVKMCPTCNGHYLFSHEEFCEKIENLYPNKYTILSEYTGMENKIVIKYNDCGCIKKVSPKNIFRNGNGCSSHINTENYFLTQQQYEDKVTKLHGKDYLILSKYKGVHEPIIAFHYKCMKAVMTTDACYLTRANICTCSSHDKWIEMFKKTHEQYVYEISNKYGNEFDVIGEYTGGKNEILIKHNVCDNNFLVNAQTFFNNGCCSICKFSSGESKIFMFLKNNGYKFKPQQTFPDCKRKVRLRFDFSILDENNNVLGLIEFNGKQHYTMYGFNRKNKTEEDLQYLFSEIQTRDNIKVKYCQDKNIPYLIIPYYHIYKIEKLIEDFIEKNNLKRKGELI